MPQHDPPGEKEFEEAQGVVTDLFDAWAASRECAVDLTTLRQVLRFKWEYGNGDLHRWTVDDFPRLYGEWLPYKGTVDRRTLATLGPTMLAFVDFLGEFGWLEPNVCWNVRAMVTGLTVWLVDVLTDCGQCGLTAERLYASGADISDPQVQQRLLAVMARHLVEHFPPPPVEPSLLSWMDPHHVALRATRWMQPPVHRPPEAVLTAAAAGAPALLRLRQVTVWASGLPRLTQRGNPTVADAMELAGKLGVAELDLARFAGRRVPGSTLLTETHFAYAWARATGLVTAQGRCLMPTALGLVLLKRPLELTRRALATLCGTALRTQWVYGRGAPTLADTPPDLLRILVEALYCAPRPLDFDAFVEQVGGLPGAPGERSFDLTIQLAGLQRLVHQAEQLGVITSSGGAVAVGNDGTVRRIGGRLSLTPLGLWCVNRLLRSEGLPTPVFGELANFDAVTLLEMCAGYDDEAAAEEGRLWAAVHGAGAAAELAEAIRGAEHPTARMSGFAVMSGIGRRAEQAVRSLLDEPRIRPFALIWLIERDLESYEAIRSEDIAHMMVEAMVSYLHEDPAKAVYMFARGRSIDDQIADIAHVWRLNNPYAVPLLEAIAARHPSDEVAHAARVALRTR